MSESKQLIEVLGRCSKTNIPILVKEEVAGAAEIFWQIAGRESVYRAVAEDYKLPEIVSMSRRPACEGILIREVEKFSVIVQVRFAGTLTKMESAERGKFILTSSNYDVLHPMLLSQVCKIKDVYPAAWEAAGGEGLKKL